MRSFAPDYTDLSASTNPRLDKNGMPCALVIVELPVEDCRFQGNIVGDVEFMGTQYNVYLTAGTKMLRIMCPGSETFMAELVDEAGNAGVMSKVTYHLFLDGYDTGSANSQPSGPKGSYLTINITPKTNIIVRIDGEWQPVENGEVVKFLQPGLHDISVEGAGYSPYSEKVMIDNSGTKSLDIVLQSNKAVLTVTTVTPGATIKVDNKQRGTDKVTLELAAGQYLVEAEKEGYHNKSQIIILGESEKKNITLPELKPIYGALDVDYRPVGATIALDDRQVGTTPALLRDILVGNHNVTVSKDGYLTYTTTVSITDGETTSLKGSLSEKPKISYGEILKKYSNVHDFHDGMAMIRISHPDESYKYGYINESYETVVPPKYSWASDFREGLAVVELNGKYGYINTSGEVVIPIKYNEADPIIEGLAFVSEKRGVYGVIDKTGKTVIPFKLNYDYIGWFSEGMANVRRNGKYGYINRSGQLVIPLKYSNVGSFSEGVARAELNGKYGFIDKTGKVVIPFKYQYALDFREGLAHVTIPGKEGGGYINHAGDIVVPLKYDWTLWFSEGLAAVSIGRKYGFVNKSGEEVIPLKYDKVDDFKNGLARVILNSKYGYVNKDGEEVIPLIYNYLGEFNKHGLAEARLGDSNGFIDMQGNFTQLPK